MWILVPKLSVVAVFFSQMGESRSLIPRRCPALLHLGLFGPKNSFADMKESKFTRTELLENISTLKNENQELRTQVTEYADSSSKSNSYLRSIEEFLVKDHEARQRSFVPRWIDSLYNFLYNKDKPTHYELLLEQIRISACTVLQLEGEVSTLEKDSLIMKDLLATQNLSLKKLELQFDALTKVNERLKTAIRNKRENKEICKTIAKLQDQMDKARNAIHRLTFQRDSLSKAKDKERISFQLRIERNECKIESLEKELGKKQMRVADLKASTTMEKDLQIEKLLEENCRMKDDNLHLRAKIDSLEKDSVVKRRLLGGMRIDWRPTMTSNGDGIS